MQREHDGGLQPESPVGDAIGLGDKTVFGRGDGDPIADLQRPGPQRARHADDLAVAVGLDHDARHVATARRTVGVGQRDFGPQLAAVGGHKGGVGVGEITVDAGPGRHVAAAHAIEYLVERDAGLYDLDLPGQVSVGERHDRRSPGAGHDLPARAVDGIAGHAVAQVVEHALAAVAAEQCAVAGVGGAAGGGGAFGQADADIAGVGRGDGVAVVDLAGRALKTPGRGEVVAHDERGVGAPAGGAGARVIDLAATHIPGHLRWPALEALVFEVERDDDVGQAAQPVGGGPLRGHGAGEVAVDGLRGGAELLAPAHRAGAADVGEAHAQRDAARGVGDGGAADGVAGGGAGPAAFVHAAVGIVGRQHGDGPRKGDGGTGLDAALLVDGDGLGQVAGGGPAVGVERADGHAVDVHLGDVVDLVRGHDDDQVLVGVGLGVAAAVGAGAGFVARENGHDVATGAARAVDHAPRRVGLQHAGVAVLQAGVVGPARIAGLVAGAAPGIHAAVDVVGGHQDVGAVAGDGGDDTGHKGRAGGRQHGGKNTDGVGHGRARQRQQGQGQQQAGDHARASSSG